MKYSIVKQFSNNAIDNLYKFIFKIVDFGKILYEALWAFIEIWGAFYLIFYNIFMYFYYLILYAIDRGADESRTTVFFWKKMPKRVSSAPPVSLTSEPGYIPAMYRSTKVIPKIAETVASAEVFPKTSSTTSKSFISESAGKKSIIRLFLEAIINFIRSLIRFIKSPFETLTNFFQMKLKPVREGEERPEKRKSLIDEYLKEYKKSRK